MNTISLLHNIGAYVRNLAASAFTSIIAGGAGNGVLVVGNTVDRLDPNNGSLSLSVLFSIIASATLAATKTLSIMTVTIEHSPDGVNWSTYLTPTAPGVVSTGAGTIVTSTSIAADLVDAFRYVRLKWTPTLSNTATDTATILAAATLAGTDRLPA